MNKRLIFVGGGAFTVLLALFAVMSTTEDNSSITKNLQSSFLSLEQKNTIFAASEQLTDMIGSDPVDGALAVNPSQKQNNTRLSQTISYVMNSIVDTNAPRIQAIINTDKLIYRGNDTIFIEVLLIDGVRNAPYAFPNNSQNASDAYITVDLGIADIYGDSLYTISFNITNTTGPAGSVVYKLPSDAQYGDFAIRVAGQKFSFATKLIQIRYTDSYYGSNNQNEEQGPVYNVTINFLDTQAPRLNSTIWGKIQVISPQGGEFPSQVSLFAAYGNASDNSDAALYNLSSDGSCYFTVDTSASLFTDGDFLILQAFIYVEDIGSFYSDYATVSLGDPVPSLDFDNDNGGDDEQDLIDPFSIQVYFQHESLSDLVINATQKVYFYSYFNYEQNLTSDFFQFGKGQIRAYNQSFMNLPPQNITKVQQVVNGFGSFVFTYKEFLTYFLEIQLGDMMEPIDEDYVRIKRDNITMNGPHIFMDGTVRIPLIVEGYQTRRQHFNDMIDQEMHPENNSPTFNMDILENFSFEIEDSEDTGFTYKCEDDIFTVGYAGLPPLLIFDSFPNPANFSNTLGFFYNYAQGFIPDEDGMLSQDAQIQTITFNAADVVAKFIQYTIQALYDIDQDNANLLGFGEDNMDNWEILAPLFPGSGKVTANIFGTYGPDWLKNQGGSNGSNNTQRPPSSVNRTQQGAEVSVSVLNTQKTMNFSRTIGNAEDLNIQFTANNFLDVNDYYLLTIRQRERIIYNDTFRLTKGVSTKTIKATSFNQTFGGIMTVNLYKITEAYFLFQNTTNSTLCDQNMIDQLLSNGTLVIQDNGQITYKDADVTYYQSNLTQSALNQSNLTSNSSIQLPYTPINDKNCVLLNLDQVVSFLEQRASINFFKRPATNLSVEITTNKNNYMQGEQVNATITVRNKGTGAIITDPGYLYVSTTEDVELYENETADLPTQLYLFNDIDEQQIMFLNPAKSLGQYFNSNNSQSQGNDTSFEFVMVAQQLRYYTFEMEYFQYLTRELDFGIGSDLVVKDIIGQSQLYGYNLMRSVPQNEQLGYLKDMQEQAWFDNEEYPETDRAYEPYRRNYAPADFMFNRSDVFTGQNFSHDTPSDYNRSANLDWTETLFWGSGIKITGGKANITFKTSDLSTNYRIQSNFYGPSLGVASSTKRFSVGRAFKFSMDMPDRMAVGDSYNLTLFFENFSPNNLTIRPFPLMVDYSLQIKSASGADLSTISFLARANSTSNFSVVVTPLKPTKSARIVLSARANDSSSKYEEFDEETVFVFNQALTRSIFLAGALSTNVTDNSSTVNLTVNFPDNSTFNTTQGSIFITTSMFGELLYIMDLLNTQDPETSDDCLARLDLIQQTIDKVRDAIGNNNNIQQIGIVKELQYTQSRLLKKLNSYIIYSGTAAAPVYQGFDNFPTDSTPTTAKTGSVASTAFAIFVNKMSPALGQFDDVNKTNDQHLRYLLNRKKTASSFAQATTDSDNNQKTNQTTLNAFAVMCLSGASFSNGTVINMTDDIANLVKAVNKTFNPSQTLWANQTSDAYQLALAIIAVFSAPSNNVNATTKNLTLNFLAPQLAKHVNMTTGAVEIPPKNVNTTASPFGSVDNDRVVEQTAFTVIALTITNYTQYQNQILKALKFLRQQNPAMMISNTYALNLLTRSTGMFDSMNTFGQNDSATIQVSYNGTQLSLNSVASQYGVLGQVVDISNPIYKAGSTGNFTLQVQTSTNQAKQIYYFAVWQYQDNNYGGVPPQNNSINVTVAANYTQVLLRDKKAGNTTYYGYTVTVANNDPNRGSSALVVTIRFPACLQTNMNLIKSSLAANKNVLGDINYYDDSNSVQVNVKPVASKGTTSFTVAARQISQGTCRMGYTTFKYRNSPIEYSVRPIGI